MLTQNLHHKTLKSAAEEVKKLHLRDLVKDEARHEAFYVKALGITFDFSREKLRLKDLRHLLNLAKECGLKEKVERMFRGDLINETEGRAVLHYALRAPASQKIMVENKDVVHEIHKVLDRIESFSNRVRQGEWCGFSGKPLHDLICVGIGGSYLGSEFLYEAFRTYQPCKQSSEKRRLRFLANVDPIDIERVIQDYHPETTLVVIISKTFTTAETMLNARTLKKWFLDYYSEPSAIAHHMVAVSTNLLETSNFGILPENVFGFWDWVGGRFSVSSAVGCLPLALHFGFSHVRSFLDGCYAMDNHFFNTPWENNLPLLMGLISLWNSTYLGYENVAILPYCQALLRFPAHIQQLTMESNGKRVSLGGEVLPYRTGEIYFGEPGTNGQHSFYQLLHQGRPVPAEFIGFVHSQKNINLEDEPVSHHDELMSNFFAQPDALAFGKTEQECRNEGIPEDKIPHKVFPGDRPSLSLLFKECSPYTMGLLLALYEHRTAVQGFIWGINSFDQWGVELGKVLAKNVRTYLSQKRRSQNVHKLEMSFFPSTSRLLNEYTDEL